MKTKILEICKRLESDSITDVKAKEELLHLFEHGCNYRGRAIVKSKGRVKWIYEGKEFPIIGLNMIYRRGFGVFPDGTRVFNLSLVGTEFEHRNGSRQPYAAIAETDLEILELEAY